MTTTVLTTARIREHSIATIAVAAAFAVAVLVPTVLLTARYEALGAAWGWTMGNAIAAVVALLVSRLAMDKGRREDAEPEVAISRALGPQFGAPRPVRLSRDISCRQRGLFHLPTPRPSAEFLRFILPRMRRCRAPSSSQFSGYGP